MVNDKTWFRMNCSDPIDPDPFDFRMNRRRWISAAAACGLAVTKVGTILAGTDDSQPQRYRIGCSGRSFHCQLPSSKGPGTMTHQQFLRRCHQWGCDCVELLDVTLPQHDDASLHAIKREAFLQALEVSGVSVYTDFIESDPAKRKAQLKKVREWIERTAQLGAPMLVIFPGSYRRSVPMSQAVDRVAEGVGQLADQAERHGVMLALENHAMFAYQPEATVEVVERVDHPWVGLNLDTGNFREKPYEHMATLAPKAVNCHLKLELRDGDRREPADLPRTFQILRDAGYSGRVTLQYELKADPLKEVPKYLRQMRALSNV